MNIRSFFNTYRHYILFFVLCVGFIAISGWAQAVYAAPTPAASAAAAPKETPPNPADMGAFTTMTMYMGQIILTATQWMPWIGGQLLDWSVGKFVLNIKDMLNSTGIGIAIDTTWLVIRDICNLGFIFGFVYAGIKIIVSGGDSDAKRMVSRIIIAALLINFSLLITKVIIDVSNYITVEIYNSLTINGSSTDGKATLGGKVVDIIKLQSYYKIEDGKQFAAATAAGNIAYYFMGAITFLVAGFVLAAGGIFILVRFVALVFIMIFSPLLFAATVFPSTASTASDLWKKLINYSFFAPAYLLLFLISIRILEGLVATIQPGTQGFSAAFLNENSAFGVVVVFVVAILFLIKSLELASKFGVVGGEKAVGMFTDARKRSQKALGSMTFGAGAALTRATAGRKFSKWAESDHLKDTASQKSLKGWAARQRLKAYRAGADSSFDVRKIGGVGDKLGIGEGRKGGYNTIQGEITKKEKAFAESLGTIDDSDVLVTARKKEMGAAEKMAEKEKEQLNTLRTRKNSLIRDQQNYLKADPRHTVYDADYLALQAQVDAADGDIQTQKDKIKEEEDRVAKAKVKYENEKLRRQIGSTFSEPNASDKPTIAAIEGRMGIKKGSIDMMWGDYKTHASKPDNDPDKVRIRSDIKKALAALEIDKEELKELMKKQPDGGYARVLERSRFTAWPIGRLAHMEREAGSEIRKGAEKGLPKKKDD